MRIQISLLACLFSLLFTLPSMASVPVASANVRPMQGKTMVYESYIDNANCLSKTDSSPSFTGGASVFMGDSNMFSSGKPIKLTCPNNYAMVNTTSQTSGTVVTAAIIGGGQINNNASAVCCPVKYRWVPYKASA